MKKLLFLVVILFGAYKAYQKVGNGGSLQAVDKDGKALVMLFVGPGCGELCEHVRVALKERGRVFQEVDLATPEGDKLADRYGVREFPTTLIGKQRVIGDNLQALGGMLAETYGPEALTRRERMATAGHFDSQGKAKVVLYGTKWCGYCKKQREQFATNNIPFDDIDVEASEAGMLAFSALEGNGFPLVYVGYRRFDGYHEQDVLLAYQELKAKTALR